MIIGIVGSEAAKFTKDTELKARQLISELIDGPNVTGVCSGHCHLGGIDIWTEEAALERGMNMIICAPKTLRWDGGYRERNLEIVKNSDEVHCITVRELPSNYTGMRFSSCYHCPSDELPHVKSGGCWTMKQARFIGKKGILHII